MVLFRRASQILQCSDMFARLIFGARSCMVGTLHKDNGTTIINVLSKFSCLSYIHGKDGIAAQARTRGVMLLSRQGYLTLKSTLRNKGASPTFPHTADPMKGLWSKSC